MTGLKVQLEDKERLKRELKQSEYNYKLELERKVKRNEEISNQAILLEKERERDYRMKLKGQMEEAKSKEEEFISETEMKMNRRLLEKLSII